MPFKISLLVIVYLLTAPIDALIRCPLEWVDHSATDLEFPADIVPTVSWGQRNFIARVWQHSESKYYGGRMLDSVAYYNNGSIGLTSGNYQLLSNPNSCKLNWTSTMPDEQFLVPTNSGFIGRAIVEHAYISGVLKNGVFTVVLNENTTLQALRYEILQSYSPGLKLEVKEFVLQNDNTPARKDIFGKEEVYNGGDVEIRQWVSFTKRITEYVKIDSMRSWGKIWVGRIGLDISMNVADLSVPIGMASFTFGVEDGEFKNSSVTHGSERIIEVVREVIVPPYAEVQICSTLTLKENFQADYTAIGEYSATGLTALEVQAILAEDNIEGEIVEGLDLVILEMQGTISGNLALTNKFVVESITEGTSTSCDNMREIVTSKFV